MPFELEDNEAAIIFTEDGMKIALPKQENDALVPNYIKDCVGLAALWKKDDTRLILIEMIEKLFSEFIEKEEEEIPLDDEYASDEGC